MDMALPAWAHPISPVSGRAMMCLSCVDRLIVLWSDYDVQRLAEG